MSVLTVTGSARQQARAARRVVEDALEHNGWPYSRRLSLYVDLLVALVVRSLAARARGQGPAPARPSSRPREGSAARLVIGHR